MININTTKIKIKMSIEKFELDYEHYQYESISYRAAIIDSDYLGWKYKDPENYTTIVILNNYIDITECIGFSEYGEDKTITLCNPIFHVTSWDCLGESPVFANFFHVCLFFDAIDSNLMTKCIKDYIIKSCQNSEEIEIFDFGETIKNIQQSNKINYDEIVVFARERNIIKNLNNIGFDTEEINIEEMSSGEISSEENIKISI